jgi:hypothetical protein
VTNVNGHEPSAPPRIAPRLSTAMPISTRCALVMLWLAVLDRDDAAITRALALLPDDPEVRGIAVGLCRIGLAIEPRLRCDAARRNAVDLLETFELSHRIATERI